MEGVQTNCLVVVAIDLEYCSRVWLVHSVCPSPLGWYLEVKWSFMSNAVPRDWKKRDMNSVLQSEVMWLGTPYLEKMCRMKSCASWGDMMVLWVRVKSDCLRDDQQWLELRCDWKMEGASYEIHRYGIPRLLGNQKLLEKSIGFVAHRFGMGTSGAQFAVVLDVDWKSRPIVLHTDLMKGLHLTKMTCKGMVMWVLENM